MKSILVYSAFFCNLDESVPNRTLNASNASNASNGRQPCFCENVPGLHSQNTGTILFVPPQCFSLLSHVCLSCGKLFFFGFPSFLFLCHNRPKSK